MTYSVSAKGTKDEVAAAINENVAPSHPAVAEAFKKIISEDLNGDRVSITASGYDHSCSLSFSSWLEPSEGKPK